VKAMVAKPQAQFPIFSKEEIDQAIDYVVVKKCLRSNSVAVMVSVNDVSKVLAEKHGLNHRDKGLRTLVGKRLSNLAKKGLLKLLRESPCRKYKVTSRFFEVRFGFKYSALRSKPMFYLSPVEITYIMLKQVEGENKWL